MTESKKELVYFGCLGGKGHFFYGLYGPYAMANSTAFPGLNPRVFESIDGLFTPGHTSQQGVYQTTKIGPVIIVSWWDYTVDSRPGSNSNLIAMGYANAEEIIDAAFKIFPSLMNRQERPKPSNH